MGYEIHRHVLLGSVLMARAPIIVNERGDVSLYETLAEAEVALEPIDVENNEYTIFDSEGLTMVPRIAEDRIHVKLSDSSPGPHEPEQLQEVLRRFLARLEPNLRGVAEDEIWRYQLPELIALLREVRDRPHRSRLRLWPWRGK